MYFKKGVIYVNFGGTEEVRFLGVRGESILTANLRLPGGTKEFTREYFEREFTEKQDVKPIVTVYEAKKTDPKAKSQAHNPYAR